MNFEILVATNNAHKLQEIRQILSPHHITVYGLSDLNINAPEVEENGSTYYENALIKAKSIQNLTKIAVMSDDSGIEIDGLGEHVPGIKSARYAASFGGYPKTFKHIFEALKDNSDRNAKFFCDICLVNVEDKPLRFEGITEGEIVKEITAQSDFGYDPIFLEKSLNKTYAEMSEKEKNSVSHRGRALKKMLSYLIINGLVD